MKTQVIKPKKRLPLHQHLATGGTVKGFATTSGSGVKRGKN